MAPSSIVASWSGNVSLSGQGRVGKLLRASLGCINADLCDQLVWFFSVFEISKVTHFLHCSKVNNSKNYIPWFFHIIMSDLLLTRTNQEKYTIVLQYLAIVSPDFSFVFLILIQIIGIYWISKEYRVYRNFQREICRTSCEVSWNWARQVRICM